MAKHEGIRGFQGCNMGSMLQHVATPFSGVCFGPCFEGFATSRIMNKINDETCCNMSPCYTRPEVQHGETYYPPIGGNVCRLHGPRMFQGFGGGL